MTSPGVGKPKPTQSRYDDIHARGSSFGQELSEDKVRRLLSTQIENPFSRAVREIGEFFGGMISGIADAISGNGGASYQPIEGALSERLGPIENQITRSTVRFKELADKVDAGMKKQDTITGELSDNIRETESRIERVRELAGSSVEEARAAAADAARAAGEVESAVAKLGDQDKTLAQLREELRTQIGGVYDAMRQEDESLQSKAASALEEAKAATDWLSVPREIGTSLITMNFKANRPSWAVGLEEATKEENPLGLQDCYKNTPDLPKQLDATYDWVNVDPGVEYVVSLWVKADKPGSDMTYDMRDQDGSLLFQSERAVEGFPKAGNKWRPFWVKDVPTEWTQYKSIMRVKDKSRRARFGRSYFRHALGEERNATQWIADFQIYPLVPSQAQVDDAQNRAIEAHSLLFDKQDGWNKVQERINKLNSAMWDKQGEVDTAQTQALEALEKSDKLNLEFQKAQELINRNSQAQLYMHQSLIEMLDARSPKQYGLDWENPPGKEPCPWHRNISLPCYDTPFFKFWIDENHDGSRFYVAAKGSWTGTIRVGINWSGGQLDDWILHISHFNRTYYLYGGALHIDLRHFAFNVQVEAMRRSAGAYYDANRGEWTKKEDPEGLIFSLGDKLRFKNRVSSGGLFINEDNEQTNTLELGSYARSIDTRGSSGWIWVDENDLPSRYTPADSYDSNGVLRMPDGTIK